MRQEGWNEGVGQNMSTRWVIYSTFSKYLSRHWDPQAPFLYGKYFMMHEWHVWSVCSKMESHKEMAIIIVVVISTMTKARVRGRGEKKKKS